MSRISIPVHSGLHKTFKFSFLCTSLLVFVLLIVNNGYVTASSNWLLENSFQSKPIYMVRDEVSKSPAGISANCQEQLNAMLNKRPFSSSWPMDMLDSNALLPPGLMRQTFTSVGSYKQCLKIHSKHREAAVNGQFCFLTFAIANSTDDDVSQTEKHWVKETIRVNDRFQFAFGICFPDACSKEEITQLFHNSQNVKQTSWKNIKLTLCQSEKLQTFNERLMEYDNMVAFPILMLFTCFAFLGTFWHLFGFDSSHWLMYFSLIRNVKSIFNMSDAPERSLEYRLRFLHGIRFLAMFWIFCAHAGIFLPSIIVMPISYVTRHPYDINHFLNPSILTNVVGNGFFAVQTFFFISGFLLTALMIDKNMSKITFWAYFILRYVRFIVPLMGAIIFQKIMFMIWKGPFFTSEVTNSIYDSCNDKEAWKNIFFMQNFSRKSCIRASWYLSVELQIHIIAFVLVLALRRSSYRWVYRLSIVLGSMSVVIPLILLFNGFPTMDITTYFDNYKPGVALKTEVAFLYFMPYMHMGAYFYGAIIGTLVMKNEKFLQKYQKVLWYLALTGMLSAAFYKEPSFDKLNYSHLNRGLINGVGFFFWNIGLGIVCFQLALPNVPSHAKWLCKVLTHPFHKPISRLSFSIYLTQFTILILNFSLVDDVHNVSLQSSVTFSLTCMVETVILAACLFVLFESPAYHFVRSFTKPKTGKKALTMDSKDVIEYKPARSDTEMLDIGQSKMLDSAA